jgi:hypothetical protein
MQSIMKTAGMLGVAALLFASCGKDKAPQDSDLFIGTYNGTITYKSATDDKSSTAGKVTVSKLNDVYNFAFSDGIPDVNGIKFQKENDEYYINLGSSGTSFIRINASKLNMTYVVDGKTWTANCTR